jgi:proteic killer suppression protein
MIETFKHKGLRQLFETGKSRWVAADLHKRLVRQMDVLNSAASPQDMNLPGYRFHALKGARKGTYSVTVSGNWRLTFTFTGGDAYNVDLEDYH